MKNVKSYNEFLNEDLPTKEIDKEKFPNPETNTEDFFHRGKKDDAKTDDIVKTKPVSIPAKNLMPSQDAIYLGKALGLAINGVEGGDLKAVISKDNRILDGHHRWAATIFNNPDAKINGEKCDLDIGDLVPVLRAAGDAMMNRRGVEPKGGDLNIFKSTLEDIRNCIYDGKNMDLNYYNQQKSIEWFESKGEAFLKKSLALIKKNPPPKGAPPRKDMPKIKPNQVKDVAKDLKNGNIDVRAPYVNESRNSDKEIRLMKAAFKKQGVKVDVHHYYKGEGFLTTYDNISVNELKTIASKLYSNLKWSVSKEKSQESGYYLNATFEPYTNENYVLNYEEFLNEGKWSKIMKNVRSGDKGGPWTIVVIKNGRVIKQYHTKIMDTIPAYYEEAKRKFPNAGISIEDATGFSVFNESLNEGFQTIEVKDLHFETDPEKFDDKKYEFGKRFGGVTPRQIFRDADKELERYRKQIGYKNSRGKVDTEPFDPKSKAAQSSKQVDKPRPKKIKKERWTEKKYYQWIEDMAAHGGAQNAYDMAQNAKYTPGLIDFVKKKMTYNEAPLDRIQWDIEAYA